MTSRFTRFVLRRGACAALLAAAVAIPAIARSAVAQSPATGALGAEIERRARALEPKVVAWRRDIHQHPELSNREVRTSKLVADHLRALGLEVKTGVAKTGVVGILRGGKPGPVVALRADMDALPVTEEVDLPFKSTVRSTYAGQDVGVMHACGHDNHVAILMGVAELLSGMRAQIQGTVKFIFQPAEEGAPPGEEGGAIVMVREGVLDDPKVDAIFGLHVFPFETGTISVRPQGVMAAGDGLKITVKGRQTHGALPWNGVDPIVVSAHVITGLQTVVSREINVTTAPAIVTIGTINGGVRSNIIPDSVVMVGTIRTFDPVMRDQIHEKVTLAAQSIAESFGAKAIVEITKGGSAVTYNDPALVARMRPTLERAVGRDKVFSGKQTTTSEDFSFYQQKVPGIFFFLGITPKGTDPATVAANHSPRFFADEAALVPGMKALANLAVDYLAGGKVMQ